MNNFAPDATNPRKGLEHEQLIRLETDAVLKINTIYRFSAFVLNFGIFFFRNSDHKFITTSILQIILITLFLPYYSNYTKKGNKQQILVGDCVLLHH